MTMNIKLIVAGKNTCESIAFNYESERYSPAVQSFLKRYHGKQLQCACTHQAALLKIVHRKDSDRYHVARFDASSKRHGYGCILYDEPYAVMTGDGTQAAIKITETKIHFTGNFGLKIARGAHVNDDNVGNLVPALAGVSRQTNSLQTLLRLLWIESRLHRCYRGQAKSWETLAARLSARVRDPLKPCMEINKQALSDLWCAPSEQRPAQRFGRPLWTCHKAGARTLMVGLLAYKSFDLQQEQGFLELVGLDGALRIDKAQNAAIEHSWSKTINIPGAAVVVIATVMYGSVVGERDRYLTYDRIAFMAIAPSGVPIESSHELTMERHLVAAARSFEKPLLDTDDSDTRPDFVLTDTWPNTTIEVYGMNTPEYLERKAIKEAYYAASGNPHIAWMPSEQLPDFATPHL